MPRHELQCGITSLLRSRATEAKRGKEFGQRRPVMLSAFRWFERASALLTDTASTED